MLYNAVISLLATWQRVVCLSMTALYLQAGINRPFSEPYNLPMLKSWFFSSYRSFTWGEAVEKDGQEIGFCMVFEDSNSKYTSKTE